MNQYSTDFNSFINELEHLQDANIGPRKKAFKRFEAQGFPTTSDEHWRYTNIKHISKNHYHLPDGEQPTVNSDLIDKYRIKDTIQIVILNGKIVESLSSLSQLPEGIVIQPIKEVNDKPFTTPDATIDKNTFYNWNYAFHNRGIYISAEDNCVNKMPIQLLFISQPNRVKTVYHYHNAYMLDKNAQVQLIEQYISTNELDYFNNSVTRINVGENSSINYTKIQQEAPSTSHIQSTIINQFSNSQSRFHQFCTNGSLIRNDIRLQLDGNGCSASLFGLNLSREQQHMDTNIVVDHAQPDSTSTQLFKNILNDKSKGVFNGLVIVDKDAQRTNSDQTNKNLLLSKDAMMNSNPQLEIYADDVKCSHGSTTGELEQEALYYLRSRGIDEINSKILLINGFVSEIIKLIAHPEVRLKIQAFVDEWLHQEVGK
jgi:Fe-S cluster assembly protein SufD